MPSIKSYRFDSYKVDAYKKNKYAHLFRHPLFTLQELIAFYELMDTLDLTKINNKLKRPSKTPTPLFRHKKLLDTHAERLS